MSVRRYLKSPMNRIKLRTVRDQYLENGSKRTPWGSEAIYVIILLLGGSVAGVFVNDFFKSELTLTFLILFILVLAQIGTLIYVRRHLSQDSSEVSGITSTLQRLEEHIGVEVKYQEPSDLNNSSGIDYVRDLISKAEEEILVLDYNDQSMPRYDYSLGTDIRVKHYEALINRANEQTSRGIAFVYKRICQFNPPEMAFKDMSDEVFVKHCKLMCELQHNEEKRVFLKRTIVAYPLTFILVDRSNLVLHVVAVKRVSNQLQSYLRGEIIINGPQELVNVFVREWEQIENSHYTVAVSPDEFS